MANPLTKEELEGATGVLGESRAQAPSAGLQAGTVFAGRYRIEGELGRGGMGAVYRAVDTMVGDVVALKTLDLGDAPGEMAIERFRREVRLARRVSHPNVARTHDLGESGGVHYLTMELVEGKDLEHLIEGKGMLAPAQAVPIAIGIADGLAAAHAAGIVHRDLKPGNVLLEASTGRVVLTDFGIARGAVDPQSQARTVGTVGTPLYMAPEQVRGGEVDARTDVYALGLVLFEMLTGTVPFLGETAIATAVARLDQDPPDPRTLAPIDDGLAALVLRCLSRAPGSRPASAADVARVLRQWGGVSGAETRMLADLPAATPGESSRVPTAQMPVTPSPSPGARPGATTTGGYRSLAVLPFRYRGPKDDEYLGESLTDELVDVLSRTRGLRVLASAATSRFKEDRDPQVVGGKLGVDVLVDGAVQAGGGQLRITARLIDVRTATQLWNDRFDVPLAEVFDVQERLAQRIAEALRVTLDVGTHKIDAPPAAIEAYLRGRQALSAGVAAGPGGAYGHFEEALTIAPSLGAARAGIALAAVRAWFVPGVDPSKDWPTLAKEAITRALAEASDVAESHIAAAHYAQQRCDYRDAVRELGKAIDIAPTFAGAQQALAAIEVEAGRPAQGQKRLRLAHDLDPSAPLPVADLARSLALHGEYAEADALLRSVDAQDHPAILNLRMRLAIWRGKRDEVMAIYSVAQRSPLPIARFTEIGASVYLNAPEAEEAVALIAKITPPILSPRFLAFFKQATAELLCGIEEYDLALKTLVEAADAPLIDVEWLDRCPVLGGLRGKPEFEAAARKVRARVADIWS